MTRIRAAACAVVILPAMACTALPAGAQDLGPSVAPRIQVGLSRERSDRHLDAGLRYMAAGNPSAAIIEYHEGLRALNIEVDIGAQGLVTYHIDIPSYRTDFERAGRLLGHIELAERPLAMGKIASSQPRGLHVMNAFAAATAAVRVLEAARAATRFDQFEARQRIGYWLTSATEGTVLWTDVVARAAHEPSLRNLAFLYADRARARLLWDVMHGLRALQDARLREWYARTVQSHLLRNWQMHTADKFVDLNQLDAADPMEQAAAERELARRNARLTAELSRLRNLHDFTDKATTDAIDKLDIPAAALPSFSQTQRRIGATEAVVEYHLTDNLLFIFVVRDSGNAVLRVSPRPAKDITDLVLRYAGILASDKNRPWRSEAAGLYQALWAPIANDLEGIDRVVIVPHQVLHLVPFPTLLDTGGRLLLERFSVRYLPSAAFLVEGDGSELKRESALVLGIGKFAESGLEPLPNAEPEAQEIAALLGARTDLRLGSVGTAGKQEFLQSARGYDLLHLATHARYDITDPGMSTVTLLSPEGRAEELYGYEILPLQLAADLAVLSACATYLRPSKVRDYGDDVFGFPQVLLAAGVSRVVATLWNVNDAHTRRQMKTFYTLRHEFGQAEALRKAQWQFHTMHPHYWAPFVLLGQP